MTQAAHKISSHVSDYENNYHSNGLWYFYKQIEHFGMIDEVRKNHNCIAMLPKTVSSNPADTIYSR